MDITLVWGIVSALLSLWVAYGAYKWRTVTDWIGPIIDKYEGWKLFWVLFPRFGPQYPIVLGLLIFWMWKDKKRGK